MLEEKPKWYAPRDIRFTKDQIIWVLENYDNFKNGEWPAGAPCYGSFGLSNNAKFINASEVYAEVSYRIDLCGVDGGMLEARYWLNNNDYKKIANKYGIKDIKKGKKIIPAEDIVFSRINRALKYCSGWKRKKWTYSEWYNRNGTRKNFVVTHEIRKK